jgi:hypothetical protein
MTAHALIASCCGVCYRLEGDTCQLDMTIPCTYPMSFATVKLWMDDIALGGSKDEKDAASAPSGAPSTEGPPMSSLFPLSSS